MHEPLGLNDLFVGTLAGAAVVLMGAFYALFFALGKLQRSQAFALTAFASYGLLVVAVGALVMALQLSGFWMAVAATMLVGYFLAPRAIWRLCVGTHSDDDKALTRES